MAEDTNVVPCERCAAPATQWRDERKTLSGYGTAAQSRVIKHALCVDHALEFDVSHAALTKMTGGPVPPPPSQMMTAGAISGVVGTPAHTDAITLPGFDDGDAAAMTLPPITGEPVAADDDGADAWRSFGAGIPQAKIDAFVKEITPAVEAAAAQSSAPKVDRVMLDDEQSAAMAAVWQQVIGLCYIAQQIDADAVDALIAEYDRTKELTPPIVYAQIAKNVEANRDVAFYVVELLRAIERGGIVQKIDAQ